MEGDTEYKDCEITGVQTEQEGGWVIGTGAWHFYVPADSPIEPKVGMTARFYGRGFGSPVRGLLVDGQVVYYRTAEDQWLKDHEDELERKRKQVAEYQANKADYDRRFAELPEVFQRRIERFRMGLTSFRWEHEGYELFVCEQAVAIADALKTVEAVEHFRTSTWEGQKELVPAISDDHSGNTFGFAVQLAKLYLLNPEFVVWEHGALTPLVGCEKYGCTHKGAGTA